METRSSSSSRRPRRDDANDKPHWQPQQQCADRKQQQQLLDFFAVRPDHVPPPLCLPVFLGGRVSLSTIVNTVLVIFFFWYGFRQWGFIRGFWCAYLPCCEIILQLVDVLSSQATSRNIQSLRRQGYTDGTILLYHQINLLQSQLLSFLICAVICDDPRLGDWLYVVCDRLAMDWPRIFARTVAALACSEVAFIAGHRLLHTNATWMKLHVFHHCCTTPSYSTNLLFHPLDLVVEFTGPLLTILVLHYTVWRQDQLTLLVTYTIFQLWYAYDHDEHLRLYHIRHHATCDSLYAIYIHVKGAPAHNVLQKHMYGLDGIKWTVTAGRGNNGQTKKRQA
jgi:hypothetical protein